MSLPRNPNNAQQMFEELVGETCHALERIKIANRDADALGYDLNILRENVLELNKSVIKACEIEIAIKQSMKIISDNIANVNKEKLILITLEFLKLKSNLAQLKKEQAVLDPKFDPIFDALEKCKKGVSELSEKLEKENQQPAPKSDFDSMYQKMKQNCLDICGTYEVNRKNCSDIYNQTLDAYESMCTFIPEANNFMLKIAPIAAEGEKLISDNNTKLHAQLQQQTKSPVVKASIKSAVTQTVGSSNKVETPANKSKTADKLSQNGKPIPAMTFKAAPVAPAQQPLKVTPVNTIRAVN